MQALAANGKGAARMERRQFMKKHSAQFEAALTDAVNALAEAQPADPIAFLGETLLSMQRVAPRAEIAAVAAAEVPVEQRFMNWQTKGHWLLTKDGRLYCGEFADKPDKKKGVLTAEMQMVHASGVDPAVIKACGNGSVGSGARSSVYNVDSPRKVMSGMNAAGLDVNSRAARAVVSDMTALAGDDEKEAGEEVMDEMRALLRANKYIAVGTMPGREARPRAGGTMGRAPRTAAMSSWSSPASCSMALTARMLMARARRT